jgi:D-xylose transport system substrate-binding protein
MGARRRAMREPEEVARVEEVERALRDVTLTRRDFVKKMAGLGVSVGTMLPILTACGGQGSTAGDGNEKLTLGFSLGTLSQRRWRFDKRYVEQEAQKAGADVLVQSAQDDEQVQINQAENMVSQGVDALIISPFNVDTAAPAVSAAKGAGIPVVSYNSVVNDADIDYWVARDNVAVGKLQANLATKSVPEGNYVIASGEGGVDIAQEKTKGNMEVLEPFIEKGSINLVSQQYHRAWNPALALNQFENALQTTGNKIDAILCNYDGFVLSAMQALDDAGLSGKTWVGGEDVFLEAARGIVKGTVAMSVYTDLQQMAHLAVTAAIQLAKDKTPDHNATINNGYADIPGHRVEAYAVTKENMREFLERTNWLPVDKVYAGSAS